MSDIKYPLSVANENPVVRDADGDSLFLMRSADQAEEIVRKCNDHEKLCQWVAENLLDQIGEVGEDESIGDILIRFLSTPNIDLGDDVEESTEAERRQDFDPNHQD